jgi:hypothetical protein
MHNRQCTLTGFKGDFDATVTKTDTPYIFNVKANNGTIHIRVGAAVLLHKFAQDIKPDIYYS